MQKIYVSYVTNVHYQNNPKQITGQFFGFELIELNNDEKFDPLIWMQKKNKNTKSNEATVLIFFHEL